MVEVSAKFEDLRGYENLILSLSKFSRRISARLDELLFELTEETARNLKDAIINNQPELISKKRFRSISTSWKNKKARMGWATTPLSRTNSYAKAIFTEHSGDGNHKILLPTSPYQDDRHTYNFSFQDLGNWLENGTRRHKAIKHWKPAKEHLLKEFRRRMKMEVVRAIFRRS